MNFAMAFPANGKDFFDATYIMLGIINFALAATGNMGKYSFSSLPANIIWIVRRDSTRTQPHIAGMVPFNMGASFRITGVKCFTANKALVSLHFPVANIVFVFSKIFPLGLGSRRRIETYGKQILIVACSHRLCSASCKSLWQCIGHKTADFDMFVIPIIEQVPRPAWLHRRAGRQ